MPAAAAQVLARAIPESRFALIAGSGHLIPVEQPEALNRVMGEFLGRSPE